jgi:hypothetical protein
VVNVLGFTLCSSCGRAVLEDIADAGGGRCVQCNLGLVPKPELVVRLDGADVPVKRLPRKLRKGRRTPGEKKRALLLKGAKTRAMKRLRDMHPDEYRLLLADERIKLGLDPYPVQWVAQAETERRPAT